MDAMNRGQQAAQRSRRVRAPGHSSGIARGLLLVAALLSFTAPIFADAAIVREFDVAGGGTVTVEADGASVQLDGSGSNGAVVQIRRGDDGRKAIEEDYEIAIEESGGNLGVLVKSKRRQWWSWGQGRGLEILISVPSRFDAQLSTSGGSIAIAELDGEVLARTSGGSVRIGRVSGAADIKTSGGSVTLEESGGPVVAKTSGGSIKIRRASGSVVAKTSGGSITVDEVAGAIQATTSGGSIRATLTEQPLESCELKTSGGSVVVELAPGVAVDLDASSSGGRVSSTLGTTAVDAEVETKSRLVARVNGGGPSMVLRTSGGGVRIRTID